MGKKNLHLDHAAEDEAIQVGRRFMNSSDVVGDMSRRYGADLSSVRIHHDADSAARAEQRGVDAFSTGTDVFFGRGAFDQSDPASRGLLAHELSHSLQQGVGGAEGAMTQSAPMGAAQGGLLDWFRKVFKGGRRHREKEKEPSDIVFAQSGQAMDPKEIGNFWVENNKRKKGGGEAPLLTYLKARLGDAGERGSLMNNDLGNASGSAMIKGLFGSRLAVNISGPMRGGWSDEEIGAMFENLFAGETYRRGLQPDATPEQVENMDNRFQGGFLQLKQMTYEHLKRLEQKYGSYASQMHPDDFISKLGPEFFDEMRMLQDAEQMMVSGGQFFDMDNNQEDREFKKLSDYYNNVFLTLQSYATNNKNLVSPELGYSPDPNGMEGFTQMDFVRDTYADGQGVGGPAMSKKMEKKYLRDLRKRYRKKGLRDHLFGRFK